MREAASDVCSIAHERAATKQTARQAAAHPGFDDMAPAAALLALRICTSYSTQLAPCIRGHLVRNAAHEGFCISLLAPRRIAVRPAIELESRTLGYGRHVLVATPGQVDQQQRFARQRRRELRGMRERVARFERRDDTLDAAALVECRERLVVGDRDIFGAAAVLEPGMLRTDSGIIQT